MEAEWRMLDGTAVVEMSRAAGRALVPRPRGDDPMRAETTGVGQLMLAARDAGARRIVVGCGGSATTDGGRGAYEVVGSPAALAGVEVTVACDVTTAFTDAARLFGRQKGATQEQIATLTTRLVRLAAQYRRETGIDVTSRARIGRRGGPRRRAARARRPDGAGVRPRRPAHRPGRAHPAGGPGRHG